MVQKILANLKIEIENVYVRFEDEHLKYSMGLLLPKVSCLSMGKDFQEFKGVIKDVAELFKKINAEDCSAYVNTGDSFQSFHDRVGRRSPLATYINKYANNPHSAESKKVCAELCVAVNEYINNAFKVSKNRFDKNTNHE